jgi:hypothetical protein
VAVNVVLLHMVMLGWWSQMVSAVPPAQASRQAISVVMLNPAKPQPPALVQSTPRRANALVRTRAPDTPTGTSATAETAMAVSPLGSDPSSQPATEQAPQQPQLQLNPVPDPVQGPVPSAVNMPGDRPMNLQLPKGWTPPRAERHPALEADHGQRALTLEQRLKDLLGDGRWVEERMGDGRLRLRNGNRCVYWQRSRSDVLNPFNAAPTPWTAHAGAC